mgnify:CR=1 FL=1
MVTAGFVGSRGYNQIRNVEYNQSIPTVQRRRQLLLPGRRTRRNPNFGSMRLRIDRRSVLGTRV